MKKLTKIILLILAGLTAIGIIATVVTLRAVSGDKLFYLDSRLGYVYAVSCRPVCFATGALLLFWITFAVLKCKSAISKRRNPSVKVPKDPVTAVNTASGHYQDTPAASGRFCSNCGRQISVSNKFCPFCGMSTEIKPVAENAEIIKNTEAAKPGDNKEDKENGSV